MSLKIMEVILNEQLVRLKVLADTNLMKYAIVNADNKKRQVSNMPRYFYGFPEHEVKKGDFVWLYSCEGVTRSIINTSKSLTHIFYWHAKENVWNGFEDEALLIEYSIVSNKKP